MSRSSRPRPAPFARRAWARSSPPPTAGSTPASSSSGRSPSFVSLGESFSAYGGAMALAALVGAACGLLLGRHIDAGHGRRAVVIAYAVATAVVLLRAASFGSPWLAVAANALGALVLSLMLPTAATATYNLAKASPCPCVSTSPPRPAGMSAVSPPASSPRRSRRRAFRFRWPSCWRFRRSPSRPGCCAATTRATPSRPRRADHPLIHPTAGECRARGWLVGSFTPCARCLRNGAMMRKRTPKPTPAKPMAWKTPSEAWRAA